MYHDGITQSRRDAVAKDFADGDSKRLVVLATSALGMGVSWSLHENNFYVSFECFSLTMQFSTAEL